MTSASNLEEPAREQRFDAPRRAGRALRADALRVLALMALTGAFDAAVLP